ncbi:phage distal tail protein [Adlercreutzia equolifaciens]|uniref:phage distal tail protein n=1 Tax=Adlercreutzia equolifaciens TaxID=446660 RepID=UPI0005A14B07|nr:phage tail domain-containing protein [Adlercreutzia equolifaciens]RFT84675.1 hypothetical protein DX903_05680 [Adlercreutzia equolifaciens]
MADDITMRVVRSDGAQMVFDGASSGWGIEQGDSSEWATLDQTVKTSPNIIRDGVARVSKRLDDKDRTVTAYYFGSEPEAKVRARAISFFNPKYEFRVYKTYLGVTRWYEGDLLAFAIEDNAASIMPTIKFTILSMDVYYRDADRNERPFGSSTPRLGFPFVSHLASDKRRPRDHPAGFVVSELVYSGLNTVWNTGDVPCWYRVEIRAKGEIVNPKIDKDGKFVQLNTVLVEGDVAIIDFESSPPKVTVNGVNAIALASRDSKFTGMQMQVGKNKFRFDCDNQDSRALAEVRVLFHRLYLGV